MMEQPPFNPTTMIDDDDNNDNKLMLPKKTTSSSQIYKTFHQAAASKRTNDDDGYRDLVVSSSSCIIPPAELLLDDDDDDDVDGDNNDDNKLGQQQSTTSSSKKTTTITISIESGDYNSASAHTTTRRTSVTPRNKESSPGSGKPPIIVHFNNAGSSPSPKCVLETVLTHMTNEATMGGYLAAELREEELINVYKSIVKLINAKFIEEIALVESATVAWTRVFYSMVDSVIQNGRGDVILCCDVEYAANLVAMQKIALERGIRIISIPSVVAAAAAAADDDVNSYSAGIVDIKELRNLLYHPTIGPKIRMVCITHIPTNSGVVNPVEQIGQIIHDFNQKKKKNNKKKKDDDYDNDDDDSTTTTTTTNYNNEVLYLVDACQSIGQRVVNVQDIKCHALTATGRKYLRGPRGTGFLYVQLDIANALSPSHIDHFAAPVVLFSMPPERNNGMGKKKGRNGHGDDDGYDDVSISFKYQEGAKRFEFWESSVACRLGLGVAIDYALSIGLDIIQERCTKLGMELQDLLRNEFPPSGELLYIHHDYKSRVDLVTDMTKDDYYDSYNNNTEKKEKILSTTQCGIVTFSVDDIPSHVIMSKLLEKGFTISCSPFLSTPLDYSSSSSSSDCSSVTTTTTTTTKKKQQTDKNLIRVSLTYFNTYKEIVHFVQSLKDIIIQHQDKKNDES